MPTSDPDRTGRAVDRPRPAPSVVAVLRTVLGATAAGALVAVAHEVLTGGAPGAGAALGGAVAGLLAGVFGVVGAFVTYGLSGSRAAARAVLVVVAVAWTALLGVVLPLPARDAVLTGAAVLVLAAALSGWSLAPLRHVPPWPR
ncbi:hypothetical protein [Kineococcus sp. SYSU DK005]|uniref:hypothetical protein n=1 Tax=Kineococcus sp. SYSU DK005 TaxID=3383126 RepID=UPI003D7D6DD6